MCRKALLKPCGKPLAAKDVWALCVGGGKRRRGGRLRRKRSCGSAVWGGRKGSCGGRGAKLEVKGAELLKTKQVLFEAVLGPCLWGRERADAFFPKIGGMEAGL